MSPSVDPNATRIIFPISLGPHPQIKQPIKKDTKAAKSESILSKKQSTIKIIIGINASIDGLEIIDHDPSAIKVTSLIFHFI